MIKDIIAPRGENLEGEPMLRMTMKDGGRCQHQEPLLSIRDRFQQEFMALDENYKVLMTPRSFPVELSPGLRDLQRLTAREVKEKEFGKS